MYNAIIEILKRKISTAHVRKVLGDSIYNCISKYIHEFHSDQTVSPEELLVEGLGSNILYNNGFQEVLIKEVLAENYIRHLCLQLKITFTDNIKSRRLILGKNRFKVALELIELLNLDPDVYIREDELSEEIPEETIITPDPKRFLSLHDYQKNVKDEIVLNLTNPEKANSRMLVHMPTGSGKTKTSIEAITDFIRTKIPEEGLVIWFAHSTELCDQAYNSLVDTWKLKGDYPLPIYRIFGDNDYDLSLLDHERAVVFIGFQKFNSLLNSTKKDLIKLRSLIASNTRLTIIDEAHKTLANTYLKAINYVSSNINCRIIGLTATPGRSNDINDPNNQILADYFDNNIISIRDNDGNPLNNPLSYLQKEKVLANIDHNTIEYKIDDLNPEEITSIVRNGELDKSNISKLAESPYRNRIIIDEIESALNDPNRDLVLVFACSTEHCILLKKLLEMRDINAEIVLGLTSIKDRNSHIKNFKNGKLKVLINFGVLTTGFDAPKLKTLVIARHTNSMILYSQMIGRALRGPRNGGNELNYVVDVIDNIANLGNTDFMFSYWENFWNKKLQIKNK